MKKLIIIFIKKYNVSPGFAVLIVSVILAFTFQFMRLFAGHDDGYMVKILKIGTTAVFLIWAYLYIRKIKSKI